MRWSGAIFESGPYARLYLALPDHAAKPVAAETLFDRSSPESSVTSSILGNLIGSGDVQSKCLVRLCFVDVFHAHRYGGPSTHFIDHCFRVVEDLGKYDAVIGKYDVVIGQDILGLGTFTLDPTTKGYLLDLPLTPWHRA